MTMVSDRLQRTKDFEEFFNNSLSLFTAFKSKDTRIKDFEDNYLLNICPGSRVGLDNKRVVEIFWGIRKFETISTGHIWRALIEYGATLFFERFDSGYATVILYPAYTDNRKPLEDCIILKRRLDPNKLKNMRLLKRFWNLFIAYMEVTSLDGKANFFQKLQISYLRFIKLIIIDKKSVPRKINEFLGVLIKFTLTVGLSGFIIYLITSSSENQKRKNENTQSSLLNKSIVTLNYKLDTIIDSQNSFKKLPNLVDSINDNTKRILKSLDNSNKQKK